MFSPSRLSSYYNADRSLSSISLFSNHEDDDKSMVNIIVDNEICCPDDMHTTFIDCIKKCKKNDQEYTIISIGIVEFDSKSTYPYMLKIYQVIESLFKDTSVNVTLDILHFNKSGNAYSYILENLGSYIHRNIGPIVKYVTSINIYEELVISNINSIIDTCINEFSSLYEMNITCFNIEIKDRISPLEFDIEYHINKPYARLCIKPFYQVNDFKGMCKSFRRNSEDSN